MGSGTEEIEEQRCFKCGSTNLRGHSNNVGSPIIIRESGPRLVSVYCVVCNNEQTARVPELPPELADPFEVP